MKTAEGQVPNGTSAGPTNKYDGFRDPGLDATTAQSAAPPAPRNHPAPVRKSGWKMLEVTD